MQSEKLNQLLNFYQQGIFPMAETSSTSELYLVEPKKRGVIPFETFKISKSLKKKIRQKPYSIYINKDFKTTLLACAKPTESRPETWINHTLIDFYLTLHQQKQAYSIECWQEGSFVGGLFGIAIKGAFFGESMVSLKKDTSKIALVYLVSTLIKCGFTLLDIQFITEHLKQFGAIEISQENYLKRLGRALKKKTKPLYFSKEPSIEAVLQPINQKS